MIEKILALSAREVFFAACMAYVICFALRFIMQKISSKLSGTISSSTLDVAEVYERCKELFPNQRMTFNGKEFTRGMKIKITTLQQKIIEGEFIGTNQINLICVRSGNQIIAQQIEKIKEIAPLEEV